MKKIMFNDKYGLTQAVLVGRKTMTRRILTQNYESVSCLNVNYEDHWHGELDGEIFELLPRYEVGEVVAIAQSYKDIIGNRVWLQSTETGFSAHRELVERHSGWINKMFVRAEFMPHHIRITDIKVERLQDISDEDCIKEGLAKMLDPIIGKDEMVYFFKGSDINYVYPSTCFAALIDKVSGKGTWNSNPWVFCYTFELVD